MEDVDIRIAREEELGQIIALYNMIWPKGSAPLSRKVGENIFHHVREHPDDEMYVAEHKGRLVGTFTLLLRKARDGTKECVVENIVIHPKYRRRGIGSRIVDFVTEHCREIGCPRLTITSREKSDESRAFYDALGFESHGFGFTKKIN